MKKLSLFLVLALTAGCSAYEPSASVEDITKKALSSKDVAVCQALSSAEGRAYCTGSIADSIMADAALAKADELLCFTIKNVEYKKACELMATSAKRKKEKNDLDEQKLNVAQNGNSIQACDQFEDASRKDQCRINVAARMAQAEKNPSLCGPIQDKTIKDLCVAAAK